MDLPYSPAPPPFKWGRGNRYRGHLDQRYHPASEGGDPSQAIPRLSLIPAFTTVSVGELQLHDVLWRRPQLVRAIRHRPVARLRQISSEPKPPNAARIVEP